MGCAVRGGLEVTFLTMGNGPLAGDVPDNGERLRALQPESLQLRQGLPQPARNLERPLVGPRDVHHPAGAPLCLPAPARSPAASTASRCVFVRDSVCVLSREGKSVVWPILTCSGDCYPWHTAWTRCRGRAAYRGATSMTRGVLRGDATRGWHAVLWPHVAGRHGRHACVTWLAFVTSACLSGAAAAHSRPGRTVYVHGRDTTTLFPQFCRCRLLDKRWWLLQPGLGGAARRPRRIASAPAATLLCPLGILNCSSAAAVGSCLETLVNGDKRSPMWG